MENHSNERFKLAMRIFGKRWNGLIISLLLNGPIRPSGIRSTLGISGKVLSNQLKELEAEDIIERKVYPDYPVRVEYSLTEKGQALEPVFKELKKWSDK